MHGRDNEALLDLKNFLQNKLKLGEPLILQEQSGNGKTIIESLEYYGQGVDIVFVILTPDDKFCNIEDVDEDKWKARQNVIFELGLFYGYLGRLSGRVIVLHKGKIDLPSDIKGIKYIDITKGVEASGEMIRTELSNWL